MGRVLFILRLSFMLMLTAYGKAQDLSHLFLQAHYTLNNTAVDATGLNPPIELTNAPFQGIDGVYSNGIFIGNDPTGSLIRTPSLDALYNNVFAVQLEFRIESLDHSRRAVFVCGESYRYLGFALNYDSTFQAVINNDFVNIDPIPAEENRWYTITLIYDTEAGTAKYYLDGSLIASINVTLIRVIDDGNIENLHAGTISTFKGNWRNLRVYGSENITRTNDPDLAKNLNIMPNPVKDLLHIHYNGLDTYTWSIADLDGQTIKGGDNALLSQDVDLSNVVPGVYFFSVRDQEGNISFKKELVRVK